LLKAICTYFHLAGTCVAESISDSENAGIIERQRKISVPKKFAITVIIKYQEGKKQNQLHLHGANTQLL